LFNWVGTDETVGDDKEIKSKRELVKIMLLFLDEKDAMLNS
jgi:hypothetical protein